MVLHHAELYLLARVVGHASPSHPERGRPLPKDQELKTSLSYIIIWMLAWAMETLFQQKKRKVLGNCHCSWTEMLLPRCRPIADIVSERLASRTLDHPLEKNSFSLKWIICRVYCVTFSLMTNASVFLSQRISFKNVPKFIRSQVLRVVAVLSHGEGQEDLTGKNLRQFLQKALLGIRLGRRNGLKFGAKV